MATLKVKNAVCIAGLFARVNARLIMFPTVANMKYPNPSLDLKKVRDEIVPESSQLTCRSTWLTPRIFFSDMILRTRRIVQRTQARKS
jgi:hypothetical protein